MLFLGIRNSYCCICQRALNKKIEPINHQCFLNWKGSSTAMEADTILEGFLNSINMHGLKYNKLIGRCNEYFYYKLETTTIIICFIGDGDSSVTKRLNEVLPYGNDFRVKKIECKNHLLRNYTTKLSAIAKQTDYPISIRKHIYF